MKILDIGCGNNKLKQEGAEVIGLDIRKFPCVDVVWDLEKTPLPFDDESFDVVRAEHMIEHIHNLLPLIEDIWRILKQSGTFKIRTAHYTNPFAYHPEHYSYWSAVSFDCLGLQDCGIEGFMLVNKKIELLRPFGFLEPLINRIPNFWEWRLSAFIPATMVEFELVKKGRPKNLLTTKKLNIKRVEKDV